MSIFEAHILLELCVSRCQICIVSNTDLTSTHMKNIRVRHETNKSIPIIILENEISVSELHRSETENHVIKHT